MLKTLSTTTTHVTEISRTVKFPDRLKGTMVEKWADYWKNLFIDYKQMLIELRSDIQDEPMKAMIWSTALAIVYGLFKNNPSELDFKDQLKQIDNEMILISDTITNPKAREHVKHITQGYNQGVVHYRNFGIASVIYTTDITQGCGLYRAQCQYLQPTLFSLPSKVIDVGLMGRWWNLYIKTANYDINNEN